MSKEQITVNGHELTAFDLPPEPKDEYTVHVDGLGEVIVHRDGPRMGDISAKYMRKMVAGLCKQNVELEAENAKLRELVRYMWVYDYAGHLSTCQEHIDHSAIVYQRMCALGVEVES